MRVAVALLDFGGPRGAHELVPFLSELLTDVLPGPRWFRGALGPTIARLRAPRVQPQYEAIGWSPLVPSHERLARKLGDALGPDIPIVSGMMFTPPTMDHAARQLVELAVDAVIALPLFPHYSLATSHAAFGFFHEALGRAGLGSLPVRWVAAWFDHPRYVAALAETIREGVANTPGDGPVHLVFSPHGLPVSFVRRGDPYPDHIRASVRAVLRELDWDGPAHVGWQSRVGPAAWLSPSTPEVLARVAGGGGTRVCLVPISFVSEHIETLYEIDVEYRREAAHLGLTAFGRAPALGDRDTFVAALAELVADARRTLSRVQCVRCLRDRTPVEPLRPKCPNCNFSPSPGQLRQPVPGSG